MKTSSTKIKDFSKGDKFIHYGCLFEVTENPTSWTNHGGRIDPSPTYGAKCKYISGDTTGFGGLLSGYDYMQGSDQVTYAKVIS